MKKENITLILLLIASLLLGVLFYKLENLPVYVPSDVKNITNNIKSKDSVNTIIKTRVEFDKKTLKGMDLKIDSLMFELNKKKDERDTAYIVYIQDTVIVLQASEIKKLKEVVANQDTMLTNFEYISKAKDTLLIIADNNLSKVKKQRNISILGNIVLGGLLILKK